jgi:two-component system, chemotaxis family, sensor kinase CheA
MSELDPQYKKLLALFQIEAAEHLEKMNQILLQLEADAATVPPKTAVDELFRAAHSLKGAARTVQASQIEQVAHAIESAFNAVRQRTLELVPDVADVLYDGLDAVQVLLNGDSVDTQAVSNAIQQLLGVGATDQPAQTTTETHESATLIATASDSEPPSTATTPGVENMLRTATDASYDATIRVPISRVDALMTDVSNILVSRMNIEQRAEELSLLRRQYQQWQQRWRRFHTHYIRLLRSSEQDKQYLLPDEHDDMPDDVTPLLGFLQETQQFMRKAGRALVNAERALHDDSLNLGLTTDALQRNVRNVRLLPFETILSGLQRTVRDLARDLDKEVLLQVVGTRVELDKQVLEALKDPLMHILRNAVDHGIEPATERVTAGKTAQGVILISLFQRGNKVHILVNDDGRGIDVARVQQRAQAIGLLDNAEPEQLSEADMMDLLLQPGMSTSTEVSVVSGRGVGLDVVRQHIEALQGNIQIQSTRGVGSTFEIIVPVSLSTMHCMLTRVGSELYAIPTSVVVRVLRFGELERFTVQGMLMASVDNRPVPVVSLADILERPQNNPEAKDDMLVVVINAADQLQAFLVNDIISEQEMVLRQLNHELIRVRNVSGATLLADGRVVLILNPNDLVKSAITRHMSLSSERDRPTSASVATTATPRILVVDDSITTRTLQKNILEAAGYEVITATHGVEALDALANHKVNLVLSDVEMPLMNGFELTERVRQESTWQQLPVILVTSLDTDEHRARGMRAGADAYIPKGVFDQNKLLETIRRLL